MNRIQPYEIKEIYPGHYYMLLDMLDTSDILKIVSHDYKYLWFYDLNTYSVIWNKVNDAYPDVAPYNMWLRNVRMECIIETKHLEDFLNTIDCGISLVQLNELPPPYLKMLNTTMSEKTKFQQLSNLGYLFNIVIPRPSDYGWMICSDIEYLQKIIDRLKE